MSESEDKEEDTKKWRAARSAFSQGGQGGFN